MKAEDFANLIYEKSQKDYGMCCPPTDAQDGLNILISHFLGDDWYTTMPMGVQQVNTEAIYAILRKYPEKSEGLLSRIFK